MDVADDVASSLVQLQAVLQTEGEQLWEVSIGNRGGDAINQLFAGVEQTGYPGWGVGLTCAMVEAQIRQLSTVRSILAARSQSGCLPPEPGRQVCAMACDVLYQHLCGWQADVVHPLLQQAVWFPDALPLELQLPEQSCTSLSSTPSPSTTGTLGGVSTLAGLGCQPYRPSLPSSTSPLASGAMWVVSPSMAGCSNDADTTCGDAGDVRSGSCSRSVSKLSPSSRVSGHGNQVVSASDPVDDECG